MNDFNKTSEVVICKTLPFEARGEHTIEKTTKYIKRINGIPATYGQLILENDSIIEIVPQKSSKGYHFTDEQNALMDSVGKTFCFIKEGEEKTHQISFSSISLGRKSSTPKFVDEPELSFTTHRKTSTNYEGRSFMSPLGYSKNPHYENRGFYNVIVWIVAILCFIFMMLILLSDISRAILSSNGIIVFMFLGCVLIASVVVFLLDRINTPGYRTLKDGNGDVWEIRDLS